MIELLIKSSLAVGVAFLFYKIVLQKETFFAVNRIYLLGSLVVAFALPFVNLPQIVAHQGLLAGFLEQPTAATSGLLLETEHRPVQDFSLQKGDPTPDHTEISTPPTSVQKEPAQIQKREPAAVLQGDSLQQPFSLPDLQTILLYIYLFGVTIFSLSLLFQLGYITWEIITARDKSRDGNYTIVTTSGKKAPCSFFRYIFIYPDDYDFETYEQIIAHEKTHVRLGHSIDLLLAELAIIVLWFNPLIWLFRREIEKNNEYQTDAVLLERARFPRDRYQFSLLQLAVPNKPLNITTNYNQSLIKQRIIMMNSKKSSPHAYWKYAFSIPLFLGILLLINQPVSGQERNDTSNSLQQPANRSEQDQAREILRLRRAEAMAARANVSERAAALAGERSRLSEERRASMLARKERTRSREELNKSRHPLSQQDMTQGIWYSRIRDGKYCIEFRGGNETARWNMSDCFATTAFERQSDATYTMENEVGTLKLEGDLEEEIAQGKYAFTPDPSFKDFLAEKGFPEFESNSLFHLFFADVTKSFVTYLKGEFSELGEEELVAMAIHGLDETSVRSYIELFEDFNQPKPSTDQIIAARIHGVTKDYVEELQKAGFETLDMESLMSARIHGVSGNFIRDIRKAGFEDLTLEEIITAKIHGINPEVIAQLRKLGAEDMDELVSLKIHNVSRIMYRN